MNDIIECLVNREVLFAQFSIFLVLIRRKLLDRIVYIIYICNLHHAESATEPIRFRSVKFHPIPATTAINSVFYLTN